MIVLGVYPALVLDVIGPSVPALIEHGEAARAAAGAARSPRTDAGGARCCPKSISVVQPEWRRSAAVVGAYVGRLCAGAGWAQRVLWAVVLLLVAVGLWVGFQPEGTRLAFDGSFVSDGFARFSRC